MAKQLTGIELGASWNSLGGALECVLRFLGHAVSAQRVMGVSGLAFRLDLVHDPNHGWAAGNAEEAIDYRDHIALIANLGRQAELMVAARVAPDFSDRRSAAIMRVQRAIDRGIPAIAYDLHLPRFGVVSGYDAAQNRWQVHSVMSRQYGNALAVERWPVPEHRAPLIALFLGERRRVDPPAAVRDALRFALAHSRAPARNEPAAPNQVTSGAPISLATTEGGVSIQHLQGVAAYQRWIDVLAEGAVLSPSGNAALVQLVQSARANAAQFLRGDALHRMRPAAGAALNAAATAYDAEVLALSRMATMFPYPAGGDTESRAARLVATSMLRTALVHEQQALRALEEALGSEGQ